MSVIPAGFVGGGGGHKIDNSLRLRSAASASLSRTPLVVGDRRLLTHRFRIKRGSMGSVQVISSAGTASIDRFYFNATDNLCLDVLGVNVLVTSQVFRDPSAHIIDVGFTIDTDNFAYVARANIIVDGLIVGYFSTDNRSAIGSGALTNWNNTVIQYIGRDNAGNYFEGYISEPVGVDGSKTLTYSGEPGGLGIKVAVKPIATYGTNGFYLDFKNGTSLTTLGYDVSGKGNHWTLNNVSLTAGSTYDWMLDTPTKNFATLNPLDICSGVPPTNGGLTWADNGGGAICKMIVSTMQMDAPTYWEVTLVGTTLIDGIAAINTTPIPAASGALGIYTYYPDSIGHQFTTYDRTYQGGSIVFDDTHNWLTGEVAMFYFDPATGKFYVGQVGVGWKNGGNPDAGTGYVAIANTSRKYAPACSSADSVSRHINFGQQPFAGTPPASAKTLSSNNATFKGIYNGAGVFYVVSGTGADIQTLTGGRSTWGTDQYIEVYKRRDAIEGWRWRFSSDPTNCLDSSSTAAKIPFPTLTGTSYEAYTIRCNPSMGFATGTVTHVNGVADTINDGLSNARKLILLKNEGIGTWYVYHPEATAGKLLYLEAVTIETTDATISSVLSGSFVVAAALASGTYRWVALSEIPGILSLTSRRGTGGAEGAFIYSDSTPRLLWTKSTSSATGWHFFDSLMQPYNTRTTNLFPNTTAAETTLNGVELVSNGAKIRTTTVDPNAAQAYIDIIFSLVPFGGSNINPAYAR